MPYRYSTAMLYMILSATGIYYLVFCHATKESVRYLSWMHFGIIIIHSVIGVWRWGNPELGEKMDPLYKLTQFLQTIFSLPCLVGELWLSNGLNNNLGYLHPGLSLVPLYLRCKKSAKKKIINLIVAINIVSCIIVSYLIEDYYGISAGVAFAINHFYIKANEHIFDIPTQDLYNIGFCFFSFFAYKSLLY